MPRPRTPASPFRYFNSSPEVIRLAVLLYVKYPLSLRNVEDLLAERGIDISHETVRYWWNRFGPLFASDIRGQRVSRMRGFRQLRWHLDEMYVKVNGEMRYLWRAVDHEGEILESFVTNDLDKAAALKFMKKALKRHGSPEAITTRWSALVQSGNEEARQHGEAGGRTLGQQPGRELAPELSKTRAGDAEVQANGMPAEVRIGSRQRPQPLQLRTPPRRQINLQDAPLGSACRVAVAVQLRLLIKDTRSPIGDLCALV
jgi:transposase-like protein